MKKIKIIAVILISTFLSLNLMYADGSNTLDVVKVTSKALENSWSFTAAQKSFEAASDTKISADRVPYYNAYNRAQIDYQYNNAQRQLDLIQNSIQNEAYAEYIDAVKAKYAVDIQKMELELANESYNNAALKFKLNQLSKEQLEISKGQSDAARLLLQIKERELQAKVVSLNVLMGQPSTNEYSDIIDSNMIPSSEIDISDNYINSAIANRAEILNAKDQLDIKIKQRDLGFTPIGMYNDSNYQQVKNEIDLLEIQVEMNTVNVRSEILSLYDELKNSMAALDTAVSNMKEAEKDLKSAELKYKLGTISKFDLKSQQLAYTKVEYGLKQAQLDAWFMQNQMYFAIGTGTNK